MIRWAQILLVSEDTSSFFYSNVMWHVSEYVINHSELSVVFCSANHIKELIKASTNCSVLKMIVSMDTLDPKTKSEYIDAGKEKGLEVLELKDGKCFTVFTCNDYLTERFKWNLLALES
jgi:hypothetical protein